MQGRRHGELSYPESTEVPRYPVDARAAGGAISIRYT